MVTSALFDSSAGAGRSGTYIAMDILFDYLDEEEVINVSQVVFELRLCRTEMIQKQVKSK